MIATLNLIVCIILIWTCKEPSDFPLCIFEPDRVRYIQDPFSLRLCATLSMNSEFPAIPSVRESVDIPHNCAYRTIISLWSENFAVITYQYIYQWIKSVCVF